MLFWSKSYIQDFFNLNWLFLSFFGLNFQTSLNNIKLDQNMPSENLRQRQPCQLPQGWGGQCVVEVSRGYSWLLVVILF